MRTISETKTVPAEDVTITTYGCDECEFVADHKEQVERHFAETHACRKEAEVGNSTLRWFKTEEDAKVWLRRNEDWYRVQEVTWEGPGWYASETWSEPCPKGCCTDHCIRLYPAESKVNNAVYEAREIMQQVAVLRKFLKENGDAPG